MNIRIPVNSNLEGRKWIVIRKNNVYKGVKKGSESGNDQKDREDRKGQEGDRKEAHGEWTTVSRRKRKSKQVYYWSVVGHNLYDTEKDTRNLHLYFIDPDASQIDNLDYNNYMTIDGSGQLRLIHRRLKYHQIKMTPNYFIAESSKQVEEALKYVKYCVVHTDNNEQKLIDK